MFGAVGHFVEKIRRVAYGPLVLDLEPGKLRELSADEVAVLRLTAEGKLKPRRVKTQAMLPKEAGRTVGRGPEKPYFKRGQSRPQERSFVRAVRAVPGKGGSSEGVSLERPRRSPGRTSNHAHFAPRGPRRSPGRAPNRAHFVPRARAAGQAAL